MQFIAKIVKAKAFMQDLILTKLTTKISNNKKTCSLIFQIPLWAMWPWTEIRSTWSELVFLNTHETQWLSPWGKAWKIRLHFSESLKKKKRPSGFFFLFFSHIMTKSAFRPLPLCQGNRTQWLGKGVHITADKNKLLKKKKPKLWAPRKAGEEREKKKLNF